MNKITKLFAVRALTNMHVGSGDTNYGVIDNLVQRDVLTNLPTIHSSSLKGALREFCEIKFGENRGDKVFDIFGDSGKKDQKYDFFGADLLSVPVRSNKVAFFNAVSPLQLNRINEKLKLLGKELPKMVQDLIALMPDVNKPFVFAKEYENSIIEEQDWKATLCTAIQPGNFPGWLGNNLVLMNDEDFRQLCDDMPVIARNKLENGESQNLWYEEIVPHQTRFVFALSVPEKHVYLNDFMCITKEPVQIGANASIGYGYTEIKEID